jgi:rubrerythrin
MSFKQDVLMSELGIMLEKEREMKELYSEILKRLENTSLRTKVEFILKEEIRHIGYVEILISMLEGGPAGKGSEARG